MGNLSNADKEQTHELMGNLPRIQSIYKYIRIGGNKSMHPSLHRSISNKWSYIYKFIQMTQ